MKILITGGMGFIGSHLCEALLADHSIVILDNLKRNALQHAGLMDHAKITFVQGDIRDAASVAKAVAGVDAVIHGAAIAGIDSVGVNAIDTLDVNLMGTHRLLEALKDRKISRFIQFSTSEVYGPYIYKGTENDLTSQGPVGQVRWAYSVSKLAAEHLAFAYRSRYGLPVVSVRPFNIYGPRQVGEGAIQKFILHAVSGEDLLINGDGTQIRSWCYITDFVNGLLRCFHEPRAVGEVFNLGNPQAAISTAELARMIITMGASKSKIRFRPALEADVEVRVPSIQKAREILGYEPQVDLAQGLRQTIAWQQSHRQGS
jgi:nucleoside-diphosphate-sugar epimerase